jgi:hypothetical protein
LTIGGWETTKVSLATKIINNRWWRWAMMKVSLTTHHCFLTDGGGQQRVTMVSRNSNGGGLADDNKQPQWAVADGKVSSCFLL